MNNVSTSELLAIALNDELLSTGRVLTTQLIKGEKLELHVLIEGREEFPIFLTINNSQILCVSHLWQEQNIIPHQREQLLEKLLCLNMPMPLSAFSKSGKQYLIFGSLSNDSSITNIVREIETLSENTQDAIELMAPYLQKI